MKFEKSDEPSVVYGRGINDKKYKTHFDREDGKSKPIREYRMWTSMLSRCYSEKYRLPTYTQCFVGDSFIKYSDFCDWLYKQHGYIWLKENNIDFETCDWAIDKDILVRGNKEYSASTCCFVPRQINSLFILRGGDRGELPLGVSYHKPHRKYVAQLGLGKGKPITIGAYKTVEEAFLAYKKAKEGYIKEQANKWKDCLDDVVYNSLMNFIIEENM